VPHHPDDQRYPHLRLARQDKSFERRKKQPHFPQRPARGGRQKFFQLFDSKLTTLEEQASQATPAALGIKPHLVFRVPVTPATPVDILAEQLQEVGLTVVAIEADKAIIAFRDDTDLGDFRRALNTYRKGPKPGKKPRQQNSWVNSGCGKWPS
jgi:hypothetical protein